jgi:hypothetical protein
MEGLRNTTENINQGSRPRVDISFPEFPNSIKAIFPTADIILILRVRKGEDITFQISAYVTPGVRLCPRAFCGNHDNRRHRFYQVMCSVRFVLGAEDIKMKIAGRRESPVRYQHQ